MAFEGERALLFDRIRELESKLDREMEAHATLQQRCFDYGNPTHSSIFDERDMLKSKLGELSEAFTRMEEDRDVWRKHSDELREAGRIAVAEIQSRLASETSRANEAEDLAARAMKDASIFESRLDSAETLLRASAGRLASAIDGRTENVGQLIERIADYFRNTPVVEKQEIKS